MSQSHKLCTRCQFLVPQKIKLCTTCGSNQFMALSFGEEGEEASEMTFDATPAPRYEPQADVSLVKTTTYPKPVAPVESVEGRNSKNHRRPSPGTLRHKFSEMETQRSSARRPLWMVGR